MLLRVLSKTYSKIISVILIASFIIIPFGVLTAPKRAEAVCTPFVVKLPPNPLAVLTDGSLSPEKIAMNIQNSTEFFKTCILNGIATVIAKTIIKQLTGSIVRWINSGFKGNPSFVQNSGKFFGGIADKVAGNVIENIAPFLCSPFKLNIQLALALSQSSSLQDEIGCTLTDVQNNLSAFADGSSASAGWNNWFQVTQTPQNNPYGAAMIASAQLNISVETAQGKYQQQLDWGKGFLSFETCPTDPLAGNSLSKNPVSATGPTNLSGTPSFNYGNMTGTPMPTAGTVDYSNPSGVPTKNNVTSGTIFGPQSLNTQSGKSLAAVGSLGSLTDLFGRNSNIVAQVTSGSTFTAGSNAAAQANSNVSLTSGGSFDYGTLTGAPMPVAGKVDFSNPGGAPAPATTWTNVYDPSNQPVYGVQAGDNGCTTQTPGAVVESQLESMLGSDIRGLEIAQSIDQIFAALVGQLVSKAMGGIGGLISAGSQSSSGDSGTHITGGNSEIPILPLSGACTPSTQAAGMGDKVTWNAYVPDVSGNVTYLWNIDGNLLNGDSSIDEYYATSGEKTASVLITSTDSSQSISLDCAPYVIISGQGSNNTGTPTVSCSASPTTVSLSSRIPPLVTWQATVTGFYTPTAWAWVGDETLGGNTQSTVKQYTTTGTKTASLNYNDSTGISHTVQCSNSVTVNP